MQDHRALLKTKQRWVIKIGSALLTDDGQGLNTQAIGLWAGQMHWLRQQGVEVILVSSGAVAEGMKRFGWKTRPKLMHQLQAAAAVGQMGLAQVWESSFSQYGIITGQVLLTHEDLTSRLRYLNAKNTLDALLENHAVPIINENDTVVTDEIRLGDNDTLAALTTNLINAEVLLILTDQEGLYTKNPREHADASLIHEHPVSDPALLSMASAKGGALGKGGMSTKVLAATRAARSGAATLIASGRQPHVIQRLFEGELLGTLLLPDIAPLDAKKRWMLNQLQVRGKVFLDEGAVKVLTQQHKSLLPVGVTHVEGKFDQGDVVICYNPQGQEVARGLVNYSCIDAQKICGKPSVQIEQILGYVNDEALIHKDNLVITHKA